MRIVVLGGAGIIGRAIARDLVEDVEEVIVADLNQAEAERVIESLGGWARAAGVDVTDQASLDAVLSGADACINSVQYYFNLDIMRGCLRNKVPYVDLGGLFHMTRRQLALGEEFEQAGVTAVLGLGSCPGVANIQAGYLGAQFDTIDSVRIYNGGTLDEGESLSWAYSVETILDEISQPAMVFRDGRFQEKPPLSEEEYFLFPEPIGWANTHLSLHSEVASIPLTFANKGIRECFFKITFFGYAEAALRKMQFLAELGFAGKEPIDVKGVKVVPRDVLIALLKQAPAARTPPVNKGYKDIATEVRGRKNGHQVMLRLDTDAWPHKNWGLSGGKLMVASPPAVAARWLAARQLERPGVWPPEQIIDGAAFFEALSERGIHTSLTQQEPLA